MALPKFASLIRWPVRTGQPLILRGRLDRPTSPLRRWAWRLFGGGVASCVLAAAAWVDADGRLAQARELAAQRAAAAAVPVQPTAAVSPQGPTVDEVRAALPSGPQAMDRVQALARHAAQQGVRLQQVQVDELEQGQAVASTHANALRRTQLQLALIGPYPKLKAALAAWLNGRPEATLDRLVLRKSTQADMVEAQLTVSVWYWPEGGMAALTAPAPAR